MTEKTYEVSLNWSSIVEAENEEEAKEEVRKVFDSTLLELNVKEVNDNFNNVKEFENWLQDEAEKMPDIVTINNIVYTMDCYDMDGKEVSYANKRTEKGFIVETSERYRNGLKDSDVSDIEHTNIRNCISYQD